MYWKLRLGVVVLLFMALVGFGCTVKTYEEVDNTFPPGTILFFDDFADAEIGAHPEGWNRAGQNYSLQVVEDPLRAGGKVLRVMADAGEKRDVGFSGTRWDERAANVMTIGVEFEVLHVKGGANLYVEAPGSTTLHYRIDDGQLLRGTTLIGDLGDEWNRVRLIANRETSKVFIYFNDMENPVMGPVDFRAAVDSWEEGRVRFMHLVDTDQPIEAYYTNFKVWIEE